MQMNCNKIKFEKQMSKIIDRIAGFSDINKNLNGQISVIKIVLYGQPYFPCRVNGSH